MRDRTYAPTVLAGLGGGALAAGAGTNDWAHAEGDAAGVAVRAVAKGSEAAPLAVALALVALAAWGVVLVLRGRVRRAVAVVGGLAALGVVVATLTATGTTRRTALTALAGKGATGDTHAALAAWFFVAAAGGLLCLASFAVAVVRAPGWPAMGSKYDAPATRAERPASDQDLWRAMDEGRDPTL
ncbi:MAG: Trp biosynthesis-associated membrane protein [Nocardioidaceae bacterium]